MIITEKNDFYESYETNKRYYIGGAVLANNNSEYKGLFGRIKKILTSDDKETDNPGADIYCDFFAPAMETNRNNENISYDALEDVIMSVEMIDPIGNMGVDDYNTGMVVYEVVEDWSSDYDYGNNHTLYSDYNMAKYDFENLLREEMEVGILNTMNEDDNIIVTKGDDWFDAYIDGRYNEYHYEIEIVKKNIIDPYDFSIKTVNNQKETNKNALDNSSDQQIIIGNKVFTDVEYLKFLFKNNKDCDDAYIEKMKNHDRGSVNLIKAILTEYGLDNLRSYPMDEIDMLTSDSNRNGGLILVELEEVDNKGKLLDTSYRWYEVPDAMKNNINM